MNRVSPAVLVCPSHEKTLRRYFTSARGRAVIGRLLLARCCETVDWSASRLLFTPVS